jgi:hypothetical protein
LDTNYKYGWKATDLEDVADPQQQKGFNWNAFLFAIAVTMIVVNWGFLKPANRQMDQLNRQVAALQSTVVALTKEHGSAQNAMSLVNVLAEQGKVSDDAADSLARIADLHDRLLAEAGDLESAHEALTELASIRDEVARSSQLLDEALNALVETNRLQNKAIAVSKQTAEASEAMDEMASMRMRLIQSMDYLGDAEPILDDIAALQEQVAQMADKVDAASAVADDVKALADSLASESSQVYTASSTLEGLVSIRRQLDEVGTNVSESHETLDSLIQLKNNVLAESASIPAAIETLEQTNDLHEQFVRATQSFNQIRRWMGDVILMEPTIQRAMTTLEPLTQLGSLRRMTRNELRHAARIVQDARSQQDQSLGEQEAFPSVAAKPATPEGTTH